MKKLRVTISAMIILALLMLSGCQKLPGGEIPEKDILFKTDAEIIYGDFDATGTLTRLGNGSWRMELTKPETLAGLVITEDNGNITAEMNGLSFSAARDSLPVKSLFGLIFNAVDSAATSESAEAVKSDDGIISISGDSALGGYTVDMDAESGNYVGIRIPDKELSVVFSNFERLAAPTVAEYTVEPASIITPETAPIK